LKEKAAPVDEVTPAIRSLLDDMAETMYAAPGVGLAAPQVGVGLRIFVVDVAPEDQPSELKEFINPEILTCEGTQTYEEGCLSFPGIAEDVERAARVRVRALDRGGEAFELETEELLAVAIQHEHDHLEGILLVDHLGLLKRRMVHRAMTKRERNGARS